MKYLIIISLLFTFSCQHKLDELNEEDYYVFVSKQKVIDDITNGVNGDLHWSEINKTVELKPAYYKNKIKTTESQIKKGMLLSYAYYYIPELKQFVVNEYWNSYFNNLSLYFYTNNGFMHLNNDDITLKIFINGHEKEIKFPSRVGLAIMLKEVKNLENRLIKQFQNTDIKKAYYAYIILSKKKMINKPFSEVWLENIKPR